MLNKYSRLLVVGVGLAVLVVQPSTVWAQAGPNLVIAMSHSGNFTVGMNGIYNIVITNIGGTATSGTTGVIFVTDRLSGIVGGPGPGFTFVSMTGTGLYCYLNYGQPPSENNVAECDAGTSNSHSLVIPAGGSVRITLTVRTTVSVEPLRSYV